MRIPSWLERYDENLQKNALLILDHCNAIIELLRNNYGEGDESDIEGARTDLRDVLFKMAGDDLWSAVMIIRPQVLNGRLPVSITEEIEQALWFLKNNAANEADAEFFGKLAGQLRKRQIDFYRAVIAGEPLSVKENGAWTMHYFPGIPLSIRKEAGVRLTTHPDNLQIIISAYCLMAEKTTRYAKTAIEAVIADIRELAKNL